MRIAKLACTVFLCLGIYNSYGQMHGAYAGEIKKVSELIQGYDAVCYKYSLSAEYPNGQHQKLNGTSYVSGNEKVLCNVNEINTVVYNSKWYYRAEHKTKNIYIVDLNKHLNKGYKSDMETDLFQGRSLRYYLDSVVLKYANVKTLKNHGDTVDIDMGFSGPSEIKGIMVTYNSKSNTLISYKVRTFQPWRGNEFGKNKGISQTMYCRDFRKISNKDEYGPSSFFVIKGQKVVLKKYKDYKVNSKI